jgi:ketosteroid isomerase-like protein
MSEMDFDRFFAERCAAATAYVDGDPSLLDVMVPKEGNASFHSPRGDSVFGAAAVAERFRRDAAAFARGGTTRFEIEQKEVSGDLAFWTGFQIATVRMRGQDQPRQMRIRVTEAFRRINSTWMLTHRHADLAPQ